MLINNVRCCYAVVWNLPHFAESLEERTEFCSWNISSTKTTGRIIVCFCGFYNEPDVLILYLKIGEWSIF